MNNNEDIIEILDDINVTRKKIMSAVTDTDNLIKFDESPERIKYMCELANSKFLLVYNLTAGVLKITLSPLNNLARFREIISKFPFCVTLISLAFKVISPFCISSEIVSSLGIIIFL